MKAQIRIKGAGLTSERNALKMIRRGTARHVSDSMIEMITSDHRVFCERPAAARVALPPVVAFVQISDSGQSLNPLIGYDMSSRGAGRAAA